LTVTASIMASMMEPTRTAPSRNQQDLSKLRSGRTFMKTHTEAQNPHK